MSLHDECDEKEISPNDLSREENDSEPDRKSRTKHKRIHEKLSSPSRIRYDNKSIQKTIFNPFKYLDHSVKLFVKQLNVKV